jgi:4'-phosphopantetheinyl transferase
VRTAGVRDPLRLESPTLDVALWWCSLALEGGDREPLRRTLSAAERGRMERFGSEMLRSRYLAGRATLRCLLARELGIAPGEVPIVRGPRGRPQLDGPADIDFNVTHTADVALIGIARGVRIGVDVERSERAVNAAGIARKFMTEGERADPAMADSEHARRHVLRLWTCKEAMSKATGDALSAPFGRIEVRIAPRLRLAGGPPPYLPDDWRLHPVAVPEGHLATLAVWRGNNAPMPATA